MMVWKSGFNELFHFLPKIQSKCVLFRVRALFNQEEAKNKVFALIYHSLFGPLDSMGQSSELGWVHKKSSNNMYSAPL